MAYIDIGGALTNFAKGVKQGQDELEQKKLLQQQLTHQKRMWELQEQQGQQQLNINDLKVQALQDAYVKDLMIRGLDSYFESDGDNKFLNNVLQEINQKFPQYSQMLGNAVRVENISEDDYPILKQQGIDPSIVSKNKTRFVKVIDANGNVQYIDTLALAAMTGYNQYADQRKLEKLKILAALQNPQDKTPAQLRVAQRVAELTKKLKDGSITLKEKAELEYLQSNMKNFVLESKGTQELTNVVYHNIMPKVEKFEPLNTDDKAKLQQLELEAGRKAPAKLIEDYSNITSFTSVASNILKELHNMKPEEIARGAYDKGILKLKTLLSDDRFQRLSPEEKVKELKSIEFNSKLGNLIAQYLKAISGTAVAEAEYNRINNILQGGNLSNKYTLESSLKGFTESLLNQFLNKAKQDIQLYPGSVSVYYDELARQKKQLENLTVKLNKENIKNIKPTKRFESKQESSNLDKAFKLLDRIFQ